MSKRKNIRKIQPFEMKGSRRMMMRESILPSDHLKDEATDTQEIYLPLYFYFLIE